jgi:hypothetical protein
MAEKTRRASARLVDSDCRSTVELQVPVGTRFDEIVANPDRLVEIFSKFRPQGCERCISGRDFLIREYFEDVINVEFGG